jgi:hypothetical protein
MSSELMLIPNGTDAIAEMGVLWDGSHAEERAGKRTAAVALATLITAQQPRLAAYLHGMWMGSQHEGSICWDPTDTTTCGGKVAQ